MYSPQHHTIRILHLEDLAQDTTLICHALQQAGLKIAMHQVYDECAYRQALVNPAAFDLILSDFSLPAFDGLSALMLRAIHCPELPFIFVTGALGEERAVEMLHAGASDYVLKANLQRLPVAVLRALAAADDTRIRAEMQAQLNNERHLLSTVLETSGALIVLVDGHGNILRLNPAAASLLGQDTESVLQQSYVALFAAPAEQARIADHLMSLAHQPPSQHLSWRAQSGQHSLVWSAGRLDAKSDQLVISGLDVTAQEAAEQQVHFLRYFDPASGLPNRALLQLRLESMRNADPAVGLVMVGIAKLPSVRDSLGEQAANRLLKEVAHRLMPWQSSAECLARVGDDSFALLIDTPGDSVLENMLAALHAPYELDGRAIFLTAHLGIAIRDKDGSAEDLLQAATAALHHAMQQQNHYHHYQPLLSDDVRHRLEREADLHAALNSKDQLYLDYQPQASLHTGQIVGLEALMRWRHPQLGLIGPDSFIPLAESCGLIAALGEHALSMACQQSMHWQRLGLPSVPVAVNLSAVQWSQPGLISMITSTLQATGLEPEWLELELTESASMHDPVTTLATMHTLRDMGIQLAIDDFGTGFCNLGYLKSFPVDKLKIDRSFIHEITSLPDDLVISRLIIAMGHLLHLSVVAEGVETAGQLMLLAASGCDSIQGYYFSRPVDAVRCGNLLASQHQLPASQRPRLPRSLVWLDPLGRSLVGATAWLAAMDCLVFEAANCLEAFELMATHEIGVILTGQTLPDLDSSTFINRINGLYPTATAILLGATQAETSNSQCMALPLPLRADALKAVLEGCFARQQAS